VKSSNIEQDVIVRQSEKCCCWENCCVSHSMLPKMFKQSLWQWERERKRSWKISGSILTIRSMESGARVNGLLTFIHLFLEIRIATRPLRPPFFDVRQSRKNRKEGKEKKTMIFSKVRDPKSSRFERPILLMRIMISRSLF